MNQYRYDQVPIPSKEPSSSLHTIPPQPPPVQQPPIRTFSPWRQGSFRHVPWTAFLPLLFSIFATVVMVMILVLSNSRTADWDVQPQSMTATQTTQVIVYNTHYLNLGLALLLTLIPIMSILPTFFGWWRLGRTVSLSPIEVAKAFDAPQLTGVDSNADASALLKAIGDRPVRYGAVSLGQGMGYNPAWANVPEKLVMTSPGHVHEPVNGRAFVA